MSLPTAIALAAQGFHVFPVIRGGKVPAVEGFPAVASREPTVLRRLFTDEVMGVDHGYNVGIYCGRFGDDPTASLCVIDVDNKDGKDGSGALASLGLTLPPTYTQRTPTGGLHLAFTTRSAVGSSAGKLGIGLDVRGTGGFIVAAGSWVEAGEYTADGQPLAAAPAELLALCKPYVPPRLPGSNEALQGVDEERASERAIAYLRDAPGAVEGSGGDAATFTVCARVKDFGVSEAAALELLLKHWNDRCAPPWQTDALAVKVANAYHYGRSAPGCLAPEAAFLPGAVVGDGVTDLQASVAALAALPPIEYEARRKVEAERLGVRASALDDAVRAARPARAGKETEALEALFPVVEPWPSTVDGAALLKDMAAVFADYMTLPAQAAPAMALWTLWTYVFDARDTAPMLFATSPTPACGKSTCMTLVARMACRALGVSNMTSATLFRVIEAMHPTLLIDEADSFAKDDEQLRGILNSGHSRELARVMRIEGDAGERRTMFFSTWAPKMLAAIGSLPGTVESRAIIIRLQRRPPGTAGPRLGRRRFDDLRSKAVRWAADNLAAVAAFDCEPPEWLGDRPFDSWEPLFAVAAAAGGDWLQQAHTAARELSGTGTVDAAAAAGIGAELLRDIRDVFTELGSKADDARLPTALLIHHLCMDEGLRWCEHYRGQRITPAQLARLLKPFSIQSKTIRLPDGSTPKGYQLAQFEDAFSRYLPVSDTSPEKMPPHRHNVAVTGLPGVFAAATAEPCGGSEKPLKPTPLLGCGGVAAIFPGSPAEHTREAMEALFS